jgi:hypothetical protein
LRIAIHDGGPRQLVVLGVRDDSLEGTKAFAFETRDKQTAGLFNQARANRRDLVWRLAQAQDDFRQVIAYAAMVVDLGEIEVFVRQVT